MRAFLNHIKVQLKEGNPHIYSINLFIYFSYKIEYMSLIKKKKKKCTTNHFLQQLFSSISFYLTEKTNEEKKTNFVEVV